MAQSMTDTPVLHDVPLTLVQRSGNDSLGEEKLSTAAKTNSLRRFFKMPVHNRKGGDEQYDGADATEMQERKKDKDEAVDKKQQRRFHLRLGNSSKYALAATADGADDGNMVGASTSMMAASNAAITSQKSSLKNSISTYWNTVFKRNRSNVAKKLTNSDSAADSSSASSGNEDNAPLSPDAQASPSGSVEQTLVVDQDALDAEEEANETEILTREELHTLPISEETGNEEAPRQPPQ